MSQPSAPPKGVEFSDEYNKELVKLLTDRHGATLAAGETFTCGGHVSHGEAFASVQLSTRDESRVVTLEARVDLEVNDIQNPLDGRDVAVDFLDEVIAEYFDNERMLRLNLDWKEYPFGDKTVAFRGSVKNLKVDRMADEWLAKHG